VEVVFEMAPINGFSILGSNFAIASERVERATRSTPLMALHLGMQAQIVDGAQGADGRLKGAGQKHPDKPRKCRRSLP